MAESPGSEPPKLAARLLGPVAVLVALPVLLAAWTPVLPRLDFDVDPRMAGAQIRSTLGAAGLGWLALWGTAAAWAGVAVSIAAGGRARWKSGLLILAGTAAVAWHLPSTFEDAYHGVAWAWAASAGLAAAHLGRHAAARRWLLALPVGLLVPLLFQAGFYRWVSHPATVEAYEAAVAAGAWAGPGSEDPGGAAARLYERRLRIDDATGPFGFANVLGTVAAGLGVAALATVPRPRGSAWWTGGVAAAAGLAVVLLTRSAGAAAAFAAGLLVFAAAWAVAGRLRERDRRVLLPALAVGLVLGVIAVVQARGWVAGHPELWETAPRERTLLFRSQYWAGAWELWTGGAAWLGLGPGGFGPAYARVKEAVAPEAVSSSHNAFIDFAVMLGLGGLAWAAALAGWLVAAGRGVAATDPAEEAEPGPVERPEVYAGSLLAVVLFAFEAWVRLPELRAPDLLWRAVAAGGFVAVVLAARRAGRRGAAFATLGAAAAVLVHAQLDMAFHHATGAPLVWLLVGLAAGSSAPPEPGDPARFAGTPEPGRAARVLRPLSPLLAGLLALTVVTVGLGRLGSHAAALEDAAAAVRSGDAAAAVGRLRAADEAAGHDRVAERWAAATLFEVAAQAEAAGRPDAAAAIYERAAEGAEAAPSIRGESLSRLADAQEAAGLATEAVAATRARAARALGAATEASPTRPERWVRLGEARLAAGDERGAVEAWLEALAYDEQLFLDPDTQMRPDEREALWERVETLREAIAARGPRASEAP